MQGLKFTKFPYLLTMQLKRFDFDYSTMHRIKLNDRMSFPNVLNLNKFIDPTDMASHLLPVLGLIIIIFEMHSLLKR